MVGMLVECAQDVLPVVVLSKQREGVEFKVAEVHKPGLFLGAAIGC